MIRWLAGKLMEAFLRIDPIENCDAGCELPDGHRGWCGWSE